MQSLKASIVFSVAILLLDLMTTNVNLAIFYVFPLVMYPIAERNRPVFAFGAVLMGFTFAGYFFGVGGINDAGVTWHDLVRDYRLVNRGMVALNIGAIAGLMALSFGCRRYYSDRDLLRVSDELDGGAFSAVIVYVERFYAELAVVIAMLSLVMADLWVRGEINFPIFYGIPLIVLAMTGEKRLLIPALLFALAMDAIGYRFGPLPDASLIPSVTGNRILVAVALIALTVHFYRQPNRDGRSDFRCDGGRLPQGT